MSAAERRLMADAAEALRLAASSLRDLSRGWPERELHEPIRTTAARALRVSRRVGLALARGQK